MLFCYDPRDGFFKKDVNVPNISKKAFEEIATIF